MVETKTSKVPAGAVELYNIFIHGGMNRRDFLDGLKKFAVAGMTVPSLVEALMPNYAAAQQVAPTDARIKAEYLTVP